jgi:hypothetical protein
MTKLFEALRELIALAANMSIIEGMCFEIRPGYETGRVVIDLESGNLSCKGRAPSDIGSWVCREFCPLIGKSSRISFTVPE